MRSEPHREPADARPRGLAGPDGRRRARARGRERVRSRRALWISDGSGIRNRRSFAMLRITVGWGELRGEVHHCTSLHPIDVAKIRIESTYLTEKGARPGDALEIAIDFAGRGEDAAAARDAHRVDRCRGR